MLHIRGKVSKKVCEFYTICDNGFDLYKKSLLYKPKRSRSAGRYQSRFYRAKLQNAATQYTT